MSELTAALATIEKLRAERDLLAAENVALKEHGEALAVDNAALREVVERMINQFAMSGISQEEKSINPAKSLMFDAESALFMPATDAAIAGIKADGVEELADRLQKYLDEGDFSANEVGVIAGAIHCGREMAQQLREGAEK